MKLQLLATASAVALSFGTSTAHAETDQSSATVGRATAAMSSAATDYWTADNMASATPLDAIEAPSGALPSAPSTQTESADGYAPAQPATFGAESLTYFWQSKSWAVPEGYHHGKDKVHDMGAVALNTSSGRRVGDVVGWQGYKFGATQAFTDSRSFGYPVDTFPSRSGIDPNGADFRFCVGSSTLQFWRTFHCDMGHGASGGPTIYDMPLSRGWGTS